MRTQPELAMRVGTRKLRLLAGFDSIRLSEPFHGVARASGQRGSIF
jgi:hypothetical protein